jgi:hypothetical protein
MRSRGELLESITMFLVDAAALLANAACGLLMASYPVRQQKPKLTYHPQGEALKRMAPGESCWAIARTFEVHHATVARLAGLVARPRARPKGVLS